MDGMRMLQSLSLKDSRVEQATSRDRVEQVLCHDDVARRRGSENVERGSGGSADQTVNADVARYVVELYTAVGSTGASRFKAVVAVSLNRYTPVASAVLCKMDRLLEPSFKAWARREAGGGAEFPVDGSKLDVAYQLVAFKVLLLKLGRRPSTDLASLFSGEELCGLATIAIRPEELGNTEKHSQFKERFVGQHGDPFWGNGVVAHTLGCAVATQVNLQLPEAQRVDCEALKEFLNQDENLAVTTAAIAGGLHNDVDRELVLAAEDPSCGRRCQAPGRQDRLDQIAAFVQSQRTVCKQQDAKLKQFLDALTTLLERLGAFHHQQDRVSAPELTPRLLGGISTPVNRYVVFFAGCKDGRREGSSAAGAAIVWIGSSWAEKSVCWVGGYQPPQDPDAPGIGAATAGLLLGLGAALRNCWRPVHVVGDHELIVNQHRTQFRSYDPTLREFYDQVRRVADELQLGPAAWSLHPREYNRVAHAVAEFSLGEEEPLAGVQGPTDAVAAEHLARDVEYWRASLRGEALSHPTGPWRCSWPASSR